MKKITKITALVLLICVLFADSAFYAQTETEVTATENIFPQFAGGNLLAETEDGESHISVYENTSAEDFNSYCEALETGGYTIQYNYEPDYGKFAAYEKDGDVIYFYYTANNAQTRVIKENSSVLAPFEEKYTVRQTESDVYFTPVIKKSSVETETVTKPKITQLNMDYSNDNHGMVYVISLSDGSFILIDSGSNYSYPQYIHIWNVLNELNERKDGKIIIRAWIITHGHDDHYTSFVDFAKAYGSQCELEYFIYNGASRTGFPFNGSYLPISYFNDAVNSFGGTPKSLLAHTGERLVLGDAIVEILTTQEDVFEKTINEVNELSMIFRVNLGGQTAMFVGDAQILTGNTAIEIMKGYLAADFVQVAHHGYGDIGYDFYKEVGASFAFWPHETSYYTQYSRDSSSEVDRTQFWSEKNMIYYSINHIEVADPSPSTVVLPFDFKYGEVIHHDIPTP